MSPQPAKKALFLARSTYRQRRLRDVLRALPVLGLGVWLMPLLWQASPDPGRTGSVMIFVFVTWTLLIVLAALLVLRLRPEADRASDADAEPGAGADKQWD